MAILTSSAHRPIRSAALCLTTLIAAGCASLDSSHDMQRTSELIADRSGEAPQWDFPWDEPHAIWDGSSALSSDDAVRIALVNNRAIRASLERIAAARADLVQTGLLPNPVLSVGLGIPFDGSGGTTSIGAELSQQLVALWLRGDRMRAAQFDLDREILSVSDAALELVKEVRSRHAEVLYAHQERDLLLQQQQLLERLTALMQSRRDAGEASRLDVNRVRLQQRTLDAALIVQEHALAEQKLALLALMGWSESPIEWEAVNDEPSNAPHPDVPDEREIVRHIELQRLDVFAAQAEVESRAAALRIKDRQRLLRNVEAGARFERDEDRRKEIGPTISLEIPIFDTNDAQTAKAATGLREAIIEADRVRQQAVSEARIHRSNLLRVLAQLRIYEDEILPAAEENLALAQQSIDAGIVDATVLIEAQREHIDARLAINDLQRQLVLQQHALERAMGGRAHR